jgi:hypothetical protein
MGRFYVPFKGKKPAAVIINGHKLVILCPNRDELKQNLNLLGGDRVQRIESGETLEEQETFLNKFSRKLDGGIVIAPYEAPLLDVIKNLEQQLPWVQ